MTSKLPVVLVALWLAGGAAAIAQAPERARPAFTREAITAALPEAAPAIAATQPRDDWSRLGQLTTTEIVLFGAGLAGRRCRLVTVDETAMTVVDLESPNHATLRIPRADVTEIRQSTRRRGSPLGAVIGAAGGFLIGYVSAVALAQKECGGSCTDEKILIGVSLVGLPVAGGLLGYRLPGGGRRLTTVYLRP
jgi:hypothetical protein